MILLDGFSNLHEVVDRDVRHRIERGWLIVLKTCMIEDLANRLLQSISIEPRRKQGTVFGHYHGAWVLLFKGLRLILLKLVLIGL